MSLLQVIIGNIVIFLMFLLTSSSQAHHTPTLELECGENIQVFCSINRTEPVLDDYRWKAEVCAQQSSKDKMIGFKFSKPPDNLKGLEKFEIQLFMNKAKVTETIISIADRQTRCRYRNLEPADYRIKIRPINPLPCVCKDEADRCRYCQINEVDVSLKEYEDDNITNRTYSAAPNGFSKEPVTPTDAEDYSLTHMTSDGQGPSSPKHIPPNGRYNSSPIHILPNGRYNSSPIHIPPEDRDNSSKSIQSVGQNNYNSKHGMPLMEENEETTIPHESTDFYLGSLSQRQLEGTGWNWSLTTVLLIVLLIVTGILLGRICRRQRNRMLSRHRQDIKLISMDRLCETRKSITSQQNKCQDMHSSECKEMHPSWTTTREEDQNVYDSGFDSTKGWVESKSSIDRDLLIKSKTAQDISEGAFVANTLVWADMDRDLSESVRTIHTLSTEGKLTSSKRLNRVHYDNTADIIDSSHNVQEEKDLHQMSYKNEYMNQVNEKSINGKLKYDYTAICTNTSPIKTLSKYKQNCHSCDSGMPEKARKHDINEEKFKQAIFHPPSPAESAETVNVLGEIGWINVESLSTLPENTGYCNRADRYTNYPLIDAMSLGEISI